MEVGSRIIQSHRIYRTVRRAGISTDEENPAPRKAGPVFSICHGVVVAIDTLNGAFRQRRRQQQEAGYSQAA